MSESEKTEGTANSGRSMASDRPVDHNPVSGVSLPADLTADVDAWARAHAVHRSEAIRLLIERGLKLEARQAMMRGFRGLMPSPSKIWLQA
jgi:hypothetical protein